MSEKNLGIFGYLGITSIQVTETVHTWQEARLGFMNVDTAHTRSADFKTGFSKFVKTGFPIRRHSQTCAKNAVLVNYYPWKYYHTHKRMNK